jgi:hypothetical protein
MKDVAVGGELECLDQHIQAIITDLIVPALLERLLAERVSDSAELPEQPTRVESQPTA